jgi:superfamily II DNA or RNA helicase
MAFYRTYFKKLLKTNEEKAINYIEKNKATMIFYDWYFISSINIKIVSENNIEYKYLSEKFIIKYKDYLDFEEVSRYQKLSEETIELLKDKIDWNYLVGFQKSLSLEFLIRNSKRFHKVWVRCNQRMNPKIKKKFLDYMELIS